MMFDVCKIGKAAFLPFAEEANAPCSIAPNFSKSDSLHVASSEAVEKIPNGAFCVSIDFHGNHL